MGSSNSKVEDGNYSNEPAPVYYSKGLEILDNFHLLRIQQQMPRDLKVCCSGNSYKIFDESGSVVLRAVERPVCNNCCNRWICGPGRGFTMVLYDNAKNPILYLRRKSCRCDAWCCLDCVFCNHKIQVYDGEKNKLGYDLQRFGCCHPKIAIVDANQETVGKIEGPFCPCRCLCDITFNVFTPDGQGPSLFADVVTSQPGSTVSLGSAGSFAANFYYSGRIEKKWTKSSYPSVNMDHEDILLRIPDDMDTVERALLIGGFHVLRGILIDDDNLDYYLNSLSYFTNNNFY